MRTRASLSALTGRPSDMIPLAEAALLIAAEEFPGLTLPPTSQASTPSRTPFGRPSSRRRTRSPPVPFSPTFLHDAEAFAGNAGEYYDPRNSFLNDVLDRRVGIPITLSILYMEVAARVGLNTQGIGLPGPFHGAARGCRHVRRSVPGRSRSDG